MFLTDFIDNRFFLLVLLSVVLLGGGVDDGIERGKGRELNMYGIILFLVSVVGGVISNIIDRKRRKGRAHTSFRRDFKKFKIQRT